MGIIRDPFEPEFEWWLVINTNYYAGNFQHTLTGWCVGIAQACYESPHGSWEATQYRQELTRSGERISENVGFIDGESPFAITENPINSFKAKDVRGYAYTSVAIPWRRKPTREHLRFVFGRAVDFAQKVNSGWFKDKPTVAKYFPSPEGVSEGFEILGVSAVRLRVEAEVTHNYTPVKAKKYFRKKKPAKVVKVPRE